MNFRQVVDHSALLYYFPITIHARVFYCLLDSAMKEQSTVMELISKKILSKIKGEQQTIWWSLFSACNMVNNNVGVEHMFKCVCDKAAILLY